MSAGVLAPLPHLFSPLMLRGVTLRNRIVNTGHNTGLSDRNRIGDRLIAYYEARARGGVGLIITGSTSVHPSSSSRLIPAVSNWDDLIIEQYRRLAVAVHRHGATVIAQLNHAGAQSGISEGGGPLFAPSPFDSELAIETPQVLNLKMIGEIIDAFASAAVRARSGELDGVEIHAGHGNLLQQFLSPLTNWRQDYYGGTPDARLRFARQVVRAVRVAVGPDFVVGIRISAEEDDARGLTLCDTQAIAQALVEAGDLDYVSVTSGSDSSMSSLAHHYAPMYVPRLHMRHLARGIRAVVSVPVLAVGRIIDPRDAEAILAAGDADLVGMTRALIADCDLPNKALRGDYKRIRYCVGINEGCIGRLMRGLPITCVQDPTTGREHALETPPPTRSPRRILIVGAGVAGLAASLVAARRGHQVTIWERLSEPGGQIRLARRAPGRAELGAISDYLLSELSYYKVKPYCGMQATVESVLAFKPDAVVIATGSEPNIPGFDNANGRIVSARDVLNGAPVSESTVVFDSKGDMVGCTTADWLLGRGHRVTVVTPHRFAGRLMEPITWRLLHQRLLDQGAEIFVDTKVIRLTEEGIVIRHLVSGRESALTKVTTLVAACGARANDELHLELLMTAPELEVHIAGDAAAPRYIEQAIYEGHMIARAL
jgi:dimethylglycine catabolism A